MIRNIFQIIAPIQITFIPLFVIIGLFMAYRTVFRRDKAAGMVLFLGTLIIFDVYMQAGVRIVPGLEEGRMKYSEIVYLLLYFQNKKTVKSGVLSASNKRISFFYYLLAALLFIQIFSTNTSVYYGVVFFRRNILPQFLAYHIAVSGFREEKDYLLFQKYLIGLISIVALFMLWNKYLDKTIIKSIMLEKSAYYRAINHGRFGSVFGNPGVLGEFVILILPAYLILFLKKSKPRWLYLVVTLILMFLLSQTKSRASMIGIALAFFILFVLNKDKKSIVAGVVIIGVILAVFMPGYLTTSLTRFNKDAMESEFTVYEGAASTVKASRYQTFISTMEIVRNNPLGIGYGEGNYRRHAEQIAEYGTLDNPHNSYIYVLVTGGVQALICFFLFLIKFVINVFSSVRKFNSPLLIGYFCGVCAFLTAIIATPSFFVSAVNVLFGTILGLTVSLINNTKIQHEL